MKAKFPHFQRPDNVLDPDFSAIHLSSRYIVCDLLKKILSLSTLCFFLKIPSDMENAISFTLWFIQLVDLEKESWSLEVMTFVLALSNLKIRPSLTSWPSPISSSQAASTFSWLSHIYTRLICMNVFFWSESPFHIILLNSFSRLSQIVWTRWI